MKISIRTPFEEKHNQFIKLCENITISGYKPKEGDDCEYIETIEIYCNLCCEKHIVNIWVN